MIYEDGIFLIESISIDPAICYLKLVVLISNSDPFGVDHAEIRAVKEIPKREASSFHRLLQGPDGLALAPTGAVVGGDCLRILLDLRLLVDIIHRLLLRLVPFCHANLA